MCSARFVIVFVEPAAAVLFASVACTGGTVPAGTVKLLIRLTGCSTLPAVSAPGVVGTFQRHPALMLQYAMTLYFLADGRLVLPDSVGDRSLGRSVGYTCLDDPAFVQSECTILV